MIISEEAVDTVQEMARQQVRVIRDRRLVPELQDLVLKVVRCLYTDVFLREVSHAETLRKSLVSTYLHLERFENGAAVTVEITDRGWYRKEPKRWC